jgi:predicted RNA-binding Zn-ribbon protein involved in translation (DUF1610 family)
MVIQGPLRPPDKPRRADGTGVPPEMTTIRTSCPLCGDVELAPSDLALRLTPCRGTGTYHFRCPHCEEPQQRPANHRVVSILLATGVAYEVVDESTPISEREISEFVEGLDRENWREHLHS